MFSAFDNIIFDLDGTLIDSAPGVLSCLKEAVEKAEIKIDRTKLNQELIGPPLATMLTELSPSEDREKLNLAIQTFRHIYDSDPTVGCTPFPQAILLLEKLRLHNKRLFIATNKPRKPALALIDQLNLGSFDAVFTPDMEKGKCFTKTELLQMLISRFNLNQARSVMIGDAISDMTSAQSAGIKRGAVLWGYERNKERLISNADFILKE